MTNNLTERLKAATCGSRELDREVICAVSPGFSIDPMSGTIVDDDGDFVEIYDKPKPLTTSLDAALALVGEALPGWSWRITGEPKQPWYVADVSDGRLFEREHKCAPIALILALLTALEAEGET